MKRILAAALSGVMAASLCACGGSDGSGGSDANSGGDGKVSFTIYNSKNELQENFEGLAERYGEENNVDIEVYYSSDTVAAHLSTKYASSDPYTLVMTDAKDIYGIGKQYGYDMTGQDWVQDTDYAISIGGKVIGFPVCIEARGLLYNADAIKRVTGKDFDPSSIKNLDDFKSILEELVKGGMEGPTAVLKPDWSLAAHYLQQVYEEREDPEAFITSLCEGEVDLIKDAKFNALMDTFDVLKKYNTFADSPIATEDELVHQKLAEGDVVFQFGGCWDWNDITDFDYTENIGIMPVPQNINDAYTDCLVGGGSKYFYIDNSENTTDEQRAAACDFIEWLATSDEGKSFVSEECGMVSAFKSNSLPCTNVLGSIVKEYVDAGKIVPNYDFDPDDHYSRVGANMQEYLAGQIERAELAKDIEDYWSSATPIEH